MKIAVFSCAGLGDCLHSLILSHNLAGQGHEVVTFHPFMSSLQEWFPTLPIRPFPSELEGFERFFIFYEKTPWMKEMLEKCPRSQTTVLNPIATPNTDYPYWEEGRFDGRRPFADNLVTFCRDILEIRDAVKSNGLVIPPGLEHRKHLKRVVIHPTSSRPGKNWPREKFLKLSKKLIARGFDPVFVVSPEERVLWPEAPLFPSLHEVACFVYEAGYMVGNDSGIGHLASCLGVPTVSLFKNERTADFWRPTFAPAAICVPKAWWLPNIKGLRWRDQKWHWALSVGHVLTCFDELCVLSDKAAGLAALGKKDVVGGSE